jgi:uncharacterized protein (DUF433 family)
MEPSLTTNPDPSASPPARSLSQEHIVSTSDTCGGKPRIRGTRVRVKDVVLWHERMGMSPEEIVSD